MITAHGPYAAWASWLEAYARGEDLPAHHLVPVDERLGPHMQERLLRRLATAFETRAAAWADTLRRQLATDTVRRPAELGAILVAARGRLRPLQALCADPRLPEQVRTMMGNALRAMLESAQDSLENSVRRQPRGADELLAVTRENRLVAALQPARLATPPSRDRVPPPVGRQVIL